MGTGEENRVKRGFCFWMGEILCLLMGTIWQKWGEKMIQEAVGRFALTIFWCFGGGAGFKQQHEHFRNRHRKSRAQKELVEGLSWGHLFYQLSRNPAYEMNVRVRKEGWRLDKRMESMK